MPPRNKSISKVKNAKKKFVADRKGTTKAQFSETATKQLQGGSLEKAKKIEGEVQAAQEQRQAGPQLGPSTDGGFSPATPAAPEQSERERIANVRSEVTGEDVGNILAGATLGLSTLATKGPAAVKAVEGVVGLTKKESTAIVTKAITETAATKILKTAAGKSFGTFEKVLASQKQSIGSGAARITSNTATAKLTSSYFSRLAGAATKPALVVTGLLGSIGSYPFAGFIKEEALQTLSFGMKTALDGKDIAGAEEAKQLQEEILDPDIWNQIIGGVPYLNVIASLKDFYKAARVKLDIDSRKLEGIKTSIAEEAANPTPEQKTPGTTEKFKQGRRIS